MIGKVVYHLDIPLIRNYQAAGIALVQKAVELPNQVRVPYVEQGDPAGVPVVFLHGFLDSWRSFEPMLTQLPASVHAFALTQRGHGDASRPAEGYGLPDLAADLNAFFNMLQLEKAVIVGHSMGSAVALRYAIDHPDRTLALVLVGSSANLRGNPKAREFWVSSLSKLTDPVDLEFIREGLRKTLSQPVPPTVFEALVQENRKVPVFVWRAALEARWRAEGDFEGELHKVATPTLIVWGDQDARYPRSEQDAMAGSIPGARLVVYHGAGHMLHVEQPERFAADLVAFLKTLGNSTYG